ELGQDEVARAGRADVPLDAVVHALARRHRAPAAVVRRAPRALVAVAVRRLPGAEVELVVIGERGEAAGGEAARPAVERAGPRDLVEDDAADADPDRAARVRQAEAERALDGGEAAVHRRIGRAREDDLAARGVVPALSVGDRGRRGARRV